MVMDIVDTTDTHIDTDMDTIEEKDPPMLNQKPTPKLSHGMDIEDIMATVVTRTDMDTPVTMVTHTLMVVTTDTHTATTTLERGLLMPNQKPNHGMATVDIMVMVIPDMDIDTGVKPIKYYCNEHIKSATQPIISGF